MVDFVEAGIWPVMTQLVTCAQESLVKRGLEPVEFAYVQPGGLPVTDYVGNKGNCGEIIVNLNNAFPTDGFPVPAQQGLCTSTFAYELALAIFRCAPTMHGTKNSPTPPTIDEQVNATREFTADMDAMRQAILCCMKESSREYVVRTFQPYGPSGNVVGGVWTVLVGEPI